MKLPIIVLLLLIPIFLIGQITIEPTVNLMHVWLSIEDRPKDLEIRIENNTGIQHGLGFNLNAKLSDKLKVSLQSQFSQISIKGLYENLKPVGDGGPNHAANIHRWDNSSYISYSVFDRIWLGFGGHAIYQPSISGNFFGRESYPYKVLELGMGTQVKFFIEKKITLSINYYLGLQNKGGLRYQYDPLQSLGLMLGYSIDLKKK